MLIASRYRNVVADILEIQSFFWQHRVPLASVLDQTYSAETKENLRRSGWDGHVEHMCKMLGTYLLKTAWSFGLSYGIVCSCL